MKKYILSTEIIYYVSRLNEQDAFHVLTNGRLKQTNSTTKSSKTNTKYENALDDINIYTKPLYLCPSYIHDTQFIYIGLVDIDFTIKPSDFSQIESMLKSYNIIPIFEPLLKYRQIYIDILNSNTFYYTTQDLNHLKYFEQYKYLNDLIYDKLKDIVNDDTDLVWSQDLTFALTASKFKNSIQDINKFNELIWCVPFFENFLEQFLNCKTLNFYEKNDIEIFERVVKQFYFDKKPVLPNLNFFKRGINMSIFKHKKMPDSNIILVPNNNIHYLMCCEKYRNKYKVPIDIFVLNTVTDLEIIKYCQYLKCEIISPTSDEKYNDLLNSIHIGFIKQLNDVFLYLNKHIIENSEYDYEKVADEIYKKIHYSNTLNSCKDFNNNSFCEKNKNYYNTYFEDIEIYKENVINSIFHSSNIEYKGKNITPREIKYIDAFKYKKVINEKDLNDKYLRDNNDSTLKSRLVEPLKINSTTDWMCQILNRTINTIILDYDGTLVNICENPEDAVISDDVKNILTNLNKYIKVVISTGRTRECMDKLIPSDLEVFAEHCTFKRVDGKWEQLDKFNISKNKMSTSSLEYKIALFYQKRTPGSHLEIKSNGFVFHYRKCDPIFEIQPKKLYYDLLQLNSNNVKLGKKIVEYQQGSKSEIFTYYNNNLLIAGDDVTDEDMFDKKKGITIKIGFEEQTNAEYFVENVEEFIEVLILLLAKFENTK